VKPPTELASKGFAVEEWADRRFFRPLGYAFARRLVPTPVTADQVTLAALLVGLVAGHLMVYASPARNWVGVVLFVISDVLDSADGQLARMRGTSTRAGRILDGIADGLRFVNLYVHLAIRLAWGGWGWSGAALAAVALASHSFQSSAVDFMRNAYLALGLGERAEVDLPDEVARPGERRSIRARIYADYVRRQTRFFPRTVALLRGLGRRQPDATLREAWRTRQAPAVAQCAWIGQNIRWVLLAATMPFGRPAAFLWLTIIPLNGVLIWLVALHERRTAELLTEGPEAPVYA
jgi:phosphatidylglycerophosphate synthase